TAPAVPVITSGALTNSATPVISGTAEVGSTVAVTLGSGPNTATWTVTATNGTWSVNTASSTGKTTTGTGYTVANGSNSVSVVATDAAANASVAATQTLVVNTTAPVVSGVSSPLANGSYKAGTVIDIGVVFSGPVLVTGTPQLTLETGTTDRVVSYSSGSGSNTLVFKYVVQPGDTSADLDYVLTTALSLSGGTIKDVAGNDAVLTLATPGASGSLGASKALVIDTTAPAPTVALSSDTGTNGDRVTGSAGLTLNAVDGTRVITVDGSVVGAADLATATAALSDGSHTVVVTDTDAAGNVGSASLTFTLDKTAPAVPVITSGALTNSATPVISGTAEVGSTVAV
ncbi:MAG: hypothetical protein EBU82_15745, partial [Flavobacteriia bacterium]|nr:hypothetical protein [Flavobacteriia bacterium]